MTVQNAGASELRLIKGWELDRGNGKLQVNIQGLGLRDQGLGLREKTSILENHMERNDWGYRGFGLGFPKNRGTKGSKTQSLNLEPWTLSCA